MIEHLADILTEFPGSANRTCFTHILNLVAKGIMKQFNAPKGKTTGFEVEEPAEELETELDDDLTEAEGDENLGNDDVDDESRSGMSEEEISALDESVKPVRLVLSKVC